MKFITYKSFFIILTIVLTIPVFSACERPSPPAEASATVGSTEVKIDYSRPSVKGREIFGSLVPYNEVWRTGANEASTFEVDKDVLIEGEALPAGKYALFTIPGENEWTLIFNENADQWGVDEYDPGQDALRVNVNPTKVPEQSELLTFDVNQNGEVSLIWADTEVNFSVEEK